MINLATAKDYFEFLVDFIIKQEENAEQSKLQYEADLKEWKAKSWWYRKCVFDAPWKSNYSFYYLASNKKDIEVQIKKALYYYLEFGSDSQIEIEYSKKFYEWANNR